MASLSVKGREPSV